MTPTQSPENANRILIVRLTSMGDIIHALPVAAALRGACPSAHLTWLVDERWRPLVDQVESIGDFCSTSGMAETAREHCPAAEGAIRLRPGRSGPV
jgi:ADP-heptose:LPS heptosyltransferase